MTPLTLNSSPNRDPFCMNLKLVDLMGIGIVPNTTIHDKIHVPSNAEIVHIAEDVCR